MKNISHLTLSVCLIFICVSFKGKLYSMDCRRIYYSSSNPNLERLLCNDSEIVNRIIDKLFELPEVKRKNKLIDSLTNHNKGVSMRIMQRPTKLKKYYWIAVGYNNDLRFETYYNFYVWPDKMAIKYLDTDNGKILTLTQWRKIQEINTKVR